MEELDLGPRDNSLVSRFRIGKVIVLINNLSFSIGLIYHFN